ncbi:MAG: DegV family EDD domain-containing protein [Firmicutes bacterium]|nr:DegV family EDD domain-containing protein [Bacillota bacterium]
MAKFIISTDSPADLTKEMYEKLNVKVIAMGVTSVKEKGDSFPDTEVTPEMIYTAIEEKNLAPKTSAGLESDYRELFEAATKDGGTIIHFNISDKLSASHGNAKRAAEGLEGVYIVDSKTLTMGIGVQVMKAAELRDQGMSVSEAYEILLEYRDKVDVSFIINDLKYLHRGGRVSGLKLLGANLLKIRPSLQMDSEGRLVPGKKYKGLFKKCVQEFVKDKLDQHINSDKALALVGNSKMDDNELPSIIMSDLETYGFKTLNLTVGVAVTIHCGRNTIGMVFIRE